VHECVGGMVIVVDQSLVPPKARITYGTASWAPLVVVDDCAGDPASPFGIRRNPGLELSDMWFGGSPPSQYQLRIEDLGNCNGQTKLMLNVDDRDVPGADGGGCTSTTLRLPQDLPTDAEVNTCGAAPPEGQSCMPAQATCRVSDWEHECNCTCTDGTWRCTPGTIGSVCSEAEPA